MSRVLESSGCGVVLLLLSCSTVPSAELPLTLTFKTTSPRFGKPELILQGSCPLSDGVVLKIDLSSYCEMLVRDEIQLSLHDSGGSVAVLQGGKFGFDRSLERPGRYTAKIVIREDLQEKALVEEVRTKVRPGQSWTFEFDVWDDRLAAKLVPGLTEVHELVSETAEFLKKCEAASATEQGLDREKDVLLRQGKALMIRLDQHRVKALFPASVNNLYFTVRTLMGFQGRETWESLKNVVDQAPAVAGREFCLWVIKDRRRTSGQLTPALLQALQSRKDAQGVGMWAELLEKAPPSDLDGLEQKIRKM